MFELIINVEVSSLKIIIYGELCEIKKKKGVCNAFSLTFFCTS
nr:MAG TPA: hypothetical protein [Caudoviricetes sp.]